MSQNESSLPQIPQKSLSELLSEESKSHSPEFQFEIAMHYLEGIGTKKSISNALKFFMIAPRHGIRENKIVNFYVKGGMPLICRLDEKS